MKTSRRIFVIADRVWDKDNSKTKELCECVGGNNED